LRKKILIDYRGIDSGDGVGGNDGISGRIKAQLIGLTFTSNIEPLLKNEVPNFSVAK
jgi:hypothetical protein